MEWTEISNGSRGFGRSPSKNPVGRNLGRYIVLLPILVHEGTERQMTQTARDIFVVGLRNAHAMEIQARELTERQSERLDDYPEVKEKVAHIFRRPNSNWPGSMPMSQRSRWTTCDMNSRLPK